MAKSNAQLAPVPAQAPALDLSEMSKEDLQKLETEVQRALKTVDARRKAEAKRAAEAAAKEMGFSLNDLIGHTGGASGKGTVLPPKYANPADPSQTWTGRGRKPQWMQDHLDNGGTKEDLEL